jgi:hypothetical protein
LQKKYFFDVFTGKSAPSPRWRRRQNSSQQPACYIRQEGLFRGLFRRGERREPASPETSPALQAPTRPYRSTITRAALKKPLRAHLKTSRNRKYTLDDGLTLYYKAHVFPIDVGNQSVNK